MSFLSHTHVPHLQAMYQSCVVDDWNESLYNPYIAGFRAELASTSAGLELKYVW